MIKKNEFCLYCGEKMESKTAKKKFCSDLHRVYWNREKEAGTLGKEIVIKNGIAEIENYTRECVLPTHRVIAKKHHLWQEGDPKENTAAFFMKYDCMNYKELESEK